MSVPGNIAAMGRPSAVGFVLALPALSLTSSCLPFDYDFSAGTTFARSAPKDAYTDLNVVGAAQFRPMSRGVDFGAEGGAAWTLDRAVLQWRALASLGYGYVPRPFEGRVGYLFEGLAGPGSIPLRTAADPEAQQIAFITGPSAVIYLRLSDSDEVWNQDQPSTRRWEWFLFLGARELGAVAPGGDDHALRFETTGVLGLTLSHYDVEAP